ERFVAQPILDVLVLQSAQALVGVGDLVEGVHHLRLELGLDRGERERGLEIVVVELALAHRGFLAGGAVSALLRVEARGPGGAGGAAIAGGAGEAAGVAGPAAGVATPGAAAGLPAVPGGAPSVPGATTPGTALASGPA